MSAVPLAVLASEFVASAQKSYYEQLLWAGVEVLQYKLPILLHSKTIAVDDQVAMIGSSNMEFAPSP